MRKYVCPNCHGVLCTSDTFNLPQTCPSCNSELLPIVDKYGKVDARVNHPEHYGGDTIYEAIKVIEAWRLDFCLGNTVKYISRAGKKDPSTLLVDLKKALWYLERKIKNLEAIEYLEKKAP